MTVPLFIQVGRLKKHEKSRFKFSPVQKQTRNFGITAIVLLPEPID